MKKYIIPSIIANNQKELENRISKFGRDFSWIQLDFMDGRFVKNKSLMFDFKVSGKFKYEAHLMLENPLPWIKRNLNKVDLVILHFESNNVVESINYIRRNKKKARIGIALNPKTSIIKAKSFISSHKLNQILIMSVNPGKYGSKFLFQSVKKAKKARKLFPRIDIEVDGGINDKTIKNFKGEDTNKFVVGSFFQNSSNLKTSLSQVRRNLL